VVVAGRSVVVPEREALTLRAAALEERYGPLGLPARKWLRMVRPYVETTAVPEASLPRISCNAMSGGEVS
jgi:hypothetical protein